MVNLVGSYGNDVITGTSGDDTIFDPYGNDTINAGAGNDTIVDNGGSNTILAGDGNDQITLADALYGSTTVQFIQRSNTVDGGNGDDWVSVEAGSEGSLSINLGAGNDVVSFAAPFLASAGLTLGAGSDVVLLGFGYGDGLRGTLTPPVITISDFTPGAGGDVLSIAEAVRGFFNNPSFIAAFDDINPFTNGVARLLQDGADTIVQLDYDGPLSGNGPTTRNIIRLTNVTASQLTSFNLGGFDPAGGIPATQTITGTANADYLFATAGGATVSGAGGDDRITGSFRNDTLNGDDGQDRINGGGGNDTVSGGIGNDTLDGGDGSDIIQGGDGNDIITDAAGDDRIEGGAGDDQINILRTIDRFSQVQRTEAITINAGEGNDRVRFEIPLPLTEPYIPQYRVSVTADLGAGDDVIDLVGGARTSVLTLGTGRDQVILRRFSASNDINALVPVTITDFAAGATGDMIDLNHIARLVEGWDRVSNPFATGHFRLRQEGADVVLALDFDGVNGSDGLSNVARLQNVSLGALTAENFMGFDPSFGPVTAVTINGTTNNDQLFGQAGGDQINGLDGDDRIEAGFGNDVVDGGLGNDQISGGFGNDTLRGGDGNDLIEDLSQGNDTLIGGAGDDRIVVNHDFLFTNETINFDAGDGADVVDVTINESSGRTMTVTGTLGAGDDRYIVGGTPEGSLTLTLGAGSDIIEMPAYLASTSVRNIVVTDFQAGAAGDRIDWAAFLIFDVYTNNFSRGADFAGMRIDPLFENFNPFEDGHVRLVQQGANTIIQVTPISPSLSNVEALYSTVFTLQNVTATSLTAFNLGFDPLHATQAGTGAADTLTGTANRDIVDGLDGDDQINGVDGDDLLRGGSGADTIDGGIGNDRLFGGMGHDTLRGGDGADYLDGGAGSNTLDGGAGDDALDDADGGDTIIGGNGNDIVRVRFSFNGGAGSTNAGDGNDIVILRDTVTSNNAYNVNLGAGDDRLLLDGTAGQITLGAGRDRVEGGGGTITDFTTGDAGDVIELPTSFGRFSDGAPNPFETGTHRLRQDGSDVVLEYDPGKFTSGFVPNMAIRFLGTTVDAFTAANFDGFDPRGGSTRPGATYITSNLTIAQGETRSITNPRGDDSASIGAPTHFVYNSGTAQFINNGTASLLVDRPLGGDILGLSVSRYSGASSESLFQNGSTGRFTVSVNMIGSTPVTSANVELGRTYGVYGPQQGVAVTNEGIFEVSARTGQAFGILSGFSNAAPVINRGTFSVNTSYEAFGAVLGGNSSFNNSGQFAIHGGQFAAGVHFRQHIGASFTNSGTILITNDASSRYQTIAILVDPSAGMGTGLPTHTYTNTSTGRITADIVFYAQEGSTTPGANDVIENAGTLNGDILVGRGDDIVRNSGTMSGRTRLESGNDRYEGANGTHTGSIEGGIGDDTLIGGSGADDFFGGANNDIIEGGGGDDYIEGGQQNDRLTGGAGADVFAYQAGDGEDIITDFGAGDTIFIYGFAQAQSITQSGADVRINFGANATILVQNTSVASFTSDNLQFRQGGGQGSLPRESLVLQSSFVNAAGSAEIFGDNVPTFVGEDQFLRTAFIMQGRLGLSGIGLFNEGTFRLATTSGLTTTAMTLSLGSEGRSHWLVNGTAGTFEVTAARGEAIGTDGIWSVWNRGSINVSAASGDATAIRNLGIGGFDNPTFANSGAITVTASGSARGVEQSFLTSAGPNLYHNSGSVTVNGGDTSFGFVTRMSAHPVATQPQFVNSGSITVTDRTAVADSVGVDIALSSNATVWNSGTIQADYAINVDRSYFTYSTAIPYSLTIYNSGRLIGNLGLSSYDDRILNTNLIRGDVFLYGGNDFFDSRLGTVEGRIDGWDGDDIILMGAGNQQISGGFGNDTLSGGGGADVLTGGAGHDNFRFEAGFGADIVADFNTSANHDYIDVRGYSAYQSIAQQGGDVLITFSASDSLLIRNATVASITTAMFRFGVADIAPIVATAAPGPVASPATPIPPAPPSLPTVPEIVGTPGNDTLTGGAMQDIIRGLGGNDRLDGGAGPDLLYGGTGNDVYVVTGQDDVIYENPGEGTDTVESFLGFYLYDNVENLTLQGSGNEYGVGNAANNLLIGNSGQNLLIGLDGADELRGGGARDALFGVDGNDTLLGEAGIDYIVAGNGADTVDGGADADEIYGQDGNDILRGGTSFDTDIIVAGAGDDIVYGNSGLGDFDFLYGNEGNDTFYVDTPADLVFEQSGEGTDTVYANINGAGYYLYANIENLILEGNTPFGVGNAINNQLTGNAITNYLLGDAGDDILNGKGGNDVLFGEAGMDIFVFERGTGGDVIGDFQRGFDRIDLRAFGLTFAQVQAGFVQNGNVGAINLGNGDFIVLHSVTMSQLTAADFILG